MSAEQPRTAALGAIGRLSRAAVFAGMVACASTPPPVHHATPPVKPPDPAIVQQFESAPAPASGKASIRGFVHRDGQPLGNLRVTATSERGAVETQTGPHGEYTFVDIDPGTWRIEIDSAAYDPYRGSRRPQDGPPMLPEPAPIQLADGENRRFDVSFNSPAPPSYERDTGPCCKPYGAPPARRRVV